MPRNNLVIEDANIIFKNFEGRPDKFNSRGGVRQFNLRVDEDLANELSSRGLTIKPLRRRDDEEEQFYHFNVKVNYEGSRPPRVTLIGMVNGEEVSRTLLTEDTVGILDGSYIVQSDLELNLYEWDVNGKTGVKPYLTQLYATVELSPLDAKYSQYEDDHEGSSF